MNEDQALASLVDDYRKEFNDAILYSDTIVVPDYTMLSGSIDIFVQSFP